jgi:hypothetical protein
MTDEAARAADEAGDRMEAAQAVISTAWRTIGATVLPVIAGIAEKIAVVVGHVSRWMQDNPALAKGLTTVALAIGGIMSAVGPLLFVLPGILQTIQFLQGAGGIGGLVGSFGKLGGSLGGLGGSLGGLAGGLGRAGGAVAGLGSRLAAMAVAGGPIALVVLALVGLGVELYKLKQAWDAAAKAGQDAKQSWQEAAQVELQAANARGAGDIAARQMQERANAKVTLSDRWYGAIAGGGVTAKDIASQREHAGQASPLYLDAKRKGRMRAAGGPVRSGEPYIVGEQGPELFVPGAAGSIVPSAAPSASFEIIRERATSGGAVYNYVFNFQAPIYGETGIKEMVEHSVLMALRQASYAPV